MTNLEKYYNKFNEEHRLLTRHGQVEYLTAQKYIHAYLPKEKSANILDIGAGTGRYSVPLSEEGHSVSAVELVKRNLEILEKKHSKVNCWPGNALDLSFLPENKFDLTLIFGPLYHLHSQEERLKVFAEAKRVTKTSGIIMASYIMNEYSVLTYCFKEGHVKECLSEGLLSEDFHTIPQKDSLYSYLRLEDIDELNKKSNLKRIKIVSEDSSADYIRQTLNSMDEETFKIYLQYHFSICERPELLGASSHTLDILQNTIES